MSNVEPQALTYPRGVFASDWLRAGVGLFVAIVVFIAAPASTVAIVIAAVMGLAALYLVHQAMARAYAKVFVTDTGIVSRNDAPALLSWMLPPSRAIPWERLAFFRLRFFATRRDRRDGWFELTLKGGGQTIRIDDRLLAFDDVLQRARRAADAANVEYDQVTFDNLEGRSDFEKTRREA